MRDEKIALVEIEEDMIEEARKVHHTIHTIGEKDDWYLYDTISKYNINQEIEDLKEFYPAIYLIHKGELK